MVQFFQGNSLWALVRQSDWISTTVLLILLCMSIASWSVWLYNFLLFRDKKRQLHEARELLQGAQTVDELMYGAAQLRRTFFGNLLEASTRALKHIMTRSGEKFSVHDVELVQMVLDQELQEVVIQEEKPLSFLRISADTATLLGLFGTIWGLIHSFIRISEKQSADIVTVAPGIAEALITTLAGLLVAIPAVMMVHSIMTQIRFIEQQVSILADRVEWIIKYQLMK